jgi:beta-barrel assembly-enhancing protease
MRWIWCMALVAFGAAAAQERHPGQGVNFYSKDKEIALGQSLAAEVRKTTTPVNDAAVTQYVKQMSARLAAQFPADWPIEIEVIREDLGGPTHEPKYLPGGFIFVSQSLIAAARNEAEFAGMLAHAIAHVEARHATRLMTKNDLMQIGTVAMANTGRHVRTPPSTLAFQRADEREADYLAVKAMAAAGYDPGGLVRYVERVQVSSSPLGKVFETLPDRDERLAGIAAAMSGLPAREYSEGGDFARVQALVR